MDVDRKLNPLFSVHASNFHSAAFPHITNIATNARNFCISFSSRGKQSLGDFALLFGIWRIVFTNCQMNICSLEMLEMQNELDFINIVIVVKFVVAWRVD
jgi:hypothetical protein